MLLDGKELAGFIKERQARAVRSLQYTGQQPQLAVVQSKNGEVVSSKYVQIKQRYANDIGIATSVRMVESDELEDTIHERNQDSSVHGIIVQLPLSKGVDTDAIVNLIDPAKDVDSLSTNSEFDAATPTAILWLLSGYGVELAGKTVAVIGQGRLVGTPLTAMLRNSGVEPLICDEHTDNLPEVMNQAQVVIAATGQPRLVTNNLLRPGQIIIDAGTANDKGSLVGDVDPDVYQREDVKISPVPGGVGPLTVCALFENLLTAFREQAQ